MHRYAEYFREALGALWQNRTRSILTMLGMIIGTSSVIAVFGVSRAAATGIAATLNSFGQPGVWIHTDAEQNFPERAAIQYRDGAKVQAMTKGLVDYVAPTFRGQFPVRVGNKQDTEAASSIGAWGPADPFILEAGRKITQQEVDDAALVCTLTGDIAAKYFGNGSTDDAVAARNAVGSFMTIDGFRFRVIGVYSPLSGSLFNSLAGSGTVIIPMSAFYAIDPEPVDILVIYPHDSNNPDAAIAAVLAALRHIHGPQAQYTTQNGVQALGIFQSILNAVAIGLSAIGAVALVVAGIGIMNIMLVSVAERKREIGIRKSIGASRNDIVLQFLLEAVILASVGGGAGLILGLSATISAATFMTRQLGTVIIPYLLLICVAIVFSIGIGIAFGMYPALRAAQLDPVEALRS